MANIDKDNESEEGSGVDKDKIIKGAMWLSVTALIIGINAFLFTIGWNHYRHGSYTVIIIAFCLLPILFFSAYKGMKNLLDAIFS